MSDYSPIFTCPSCGSSDYAKQEGMLRCRHCGNLYRDSLMSDPIYAKLQYAVNERQEASFDKARRRYEALLSENKEGAHLEEVYWGHFLCEQYVIFYQNDVGDSIPSFWNINEEPCEKSQSYQKALRLGKQSGNAANYERLAERIEEYKAKYKKVKKEYPDGHQIFICFKDSGTTDANLGYKIYNEFSRKYNIFFSRESLNTISGNDYEPYIYHALKTAKVLIVLCSDRKNLESKWVHNEWWRFWNFSKGTDKTIIPVFRRGFSAASLPDEIRNCQAHEEDVDLISVLSNRLAAILKNDGGSGVPLTSFEKELNLAESAWSAGQIDDARLMVADLVAKSAGRPYDHISALLLQVKIFTNNYKNLKNTNAGAALDQVMDTARANDIALRDLPEYQRYRAAVARRRLKWILLSVACVAVLTAGIIGSVWMLQDPVVDMYVAGHPDSIEIEYGENPLSAIPDIITVTKKGNEETISLNESMLSGFDATKLGMQSVTVSYEGLTVQININVVKYRLSVPTALSLGDGKITWSEVAQAESYTLQINDKLITGLTSTSCGSEVFDAVGVYSVKVKAVSDGVYGHDSDFTAPISVIRLKEASDMALNGLTLSWSAVPGCTQYDVYMNDKKVATTAFNSYNISSISDLSPAAGANTFYAVPVDGANLKLAANLGDGEIDNYEHNGEVVCYASSYAPAVTWRDGKLVWDAAIGGAPTYSVYINGKSVGTVSAATYTPDIDDVTVGSNAVYVLVAEGFYLSESTEPNTLEVVRLQRASAPTLVLSSSLLRWEAVPGCTLYEVYMNGSRVGTATTNRFSLPHGEMIYGKNTFYVLPLDAPNLKNVGDLSEDERKDPAKNGEIACHKYQNLPDVTWKDGQLSWTAVGGSGAYSVYINGTLAGTSTQATYTPSAEEIRVGENRIYVTVANGYLAAEPLAGAPYEGNGVITVQRLEKVTGLRIDSMVLTWNAVSGATEYEVLQNGVSVLKTKNTFYAIVSSGAENAVFTVRALGSGNVISSEVSDERASIAYLTVPQGVAIDTNILSWNAVEHALGYEIYANDVLLATTDASTRSLNLMGKLKKGSYTLTVLAKGDGNTVFSSAKSAGVSYEVTETFIYITSEAELKNMALALDEVYVLGNNITLTSPWTPIGTTAKPFVGQFNGGGYTIQGLTLSATSGQGTGLFGVIGEGGIVENIKLEGVSATNSSYNCIGGLVGINYGTVRQVEVTGTISSTGNYIGGIVGRNHGSIYECANRADVSGGRNIGGIAGKIECADSDIKIYNCHNYGTITGTYRVGGIAGDVLVSKKNTIYGLTNAGTVTATDSYAGGCLGYVSGANGQMVTLNSCTNSGTVQAKDYAAGCFCTGTYVTVTVGNITDPSLNCSNTGSVSVTSGTNRNDIYTK